MNFCSAETEAASIVNHRTQDIPIAPRPTSPIWPWSTTPVDFDEYDEQDSEVDEALDEFEEFEEGLDVLMILERAYENTLKAHVVSTPAAQPQKPSLRTPQPSTTTPVSQPGKTALLQGSSTALLAVLDHAPRPSPTRPSSPTRSRHVSMSQSNQTLSPQPSFRHGGHLPQAPSPMATAITGSDKLIESESGAVLKIAHLGDCMGMLVRGDEIVWRSEEMWWGVSLKFIYNVQLNAKRYLQFNTPVQLGPVSPSKPLTHAQSFTLPIEQDDILILASDGLSDNLWDEDVLDEVLRMRKSFLPTSPASTPTVLEDDLRSQKGPSPSPSGLLGRRTLAGMLSEALCSRARRVSERRPKHPLSLDGVEDEVPFARRAREQGRVFRGGKVDGKFLGF